MSYPYSSFYLEAQWSKLKVAEYFDSGLDAFVRSWIASFYSRRFAHLASNVSRETKSDSSARRRQPSPHLSAFMTHTLPAR
jgi:hypothetical protein